MLIYDAINRPVLDAVPATARRLLDLGCGSGTFGRRLKESRPCEIVGVTYSEAEAALARQTLDSVLVRDLNTFDPAEAGQFDCVVCSHVLEHLYAPGQLLRRLHGALRPGATVVVALPNILHWRQRLHFLAGRFRYTEGGLMDSTHFRFFDWTTARALLTGSGYRLAAARVDGTFPLSRFLGGAGRWLDGWSTRALPGAFGTQFILVARADAAAAPAGPAASAVPAR